MPPIADEQRIERREDDDRQRADHRDRARAGHVPVAQQGAERRPEEAGGDEQQIAADAMAADGGERFRSRTP